MKEKLIVLPIGDFKLSRLVGKKMLVDPPALCRARGIDKDSLQSKIFVDEVLGYAIFGTSSFQMMKGRGILSGFLDGVENKPLQLAKHDAGSGSGLERWYVGELGGWPRATGRKQRVGILDSGIDRHVDRLSRRRDHQDFCSCTGPGVETNDIEKHGTRCAGIIAAGENLSRLRTAVAPDCKVIAGQIVRPDSSTYTTLVDLLLMLSWMIHRWRVRIVSMSFCVVLADSADMDVIGQIALRLRRLDRALLFCAAREESDGLSYPARAPGVIAVGGYETLASVTQVAKGNISINALPMTDTTHWLHKRDLLFAPSGKLSTVNPGGAEYDDFGGPSGACAFAAGMAALYMEAYPKMTVEEILDLMKGNSVPVTALSTEGNHIWRAIRFPRRKPPRC